MGFIRLAGWTTLYSHSYLYTAGQSTDDDIFLSFLPRESAVIGGSILSIVDELVF